MREISADSYWEQSNIQEFWSEISTYDHLVQIYDDEKVFIDSLEGFAGSGLLAGDCVIVIATANHLNALEDRLQDQDFYLESLIANGNYLPLNARETLAQFMLHDKPDKVLFDKLISDLISNARQKNMNIRAFGEMVALLWAEGNKAGAIQLEDLWNRFCEKEKFCLFCAYPKSGFEEGAYASLNHICSAHSKVIGGWAKPSTEIYYKNSLHSDSIVL